MLRRSFIKNIVLFLFGNLLFKSTLANTSLKSSLGPNSVKKKRSFFSAIFSRYYKLHNKKYFNFDKHLTSPEKKYVQLCLDQVPSTDYNYKPEKISFSHITWSHRVKGEQVNSSRLGCGMASHQAPSTEMIKSFNDVLKSRGISSSININSKEALGQTLGLGLGWDIQENHFKYYYLLNTKYLIKDKMSFIKAHHPKFTTLDDYLSLSIYSKTFKDNKEYEEKIYLYPKQRNLKGSLSKMLVKVNGLAEMITNLRDVVLQYDLSKLSQGYREFHLGLFNKKGQELIKENTILDSKYTLNYKNPEDFTIYFF